MDASERLGYLEQEYNRKKRLLDEEVGSQREFQQIASDYHSIRSKTAGLKSKLELLGLNPKEARQGNVKSSVPVRAPLAGYIHTIEVNTGGYVSPGQLLFEIVDNNRIFVNLLVFEKDLLKVHEDQTVYFRYSNQTDDQFYKARIFAVGKAFEQEPKAVRVHAELTEQGPNLLPGMYVEGRIVTDSTEVLALPQDAVVSDGGTSYIFVVEEQEDGHITAEQVSESNEHDHGIRFRAVEVTTGTEDDGHIEIKLLENLPENAEVVTKGAFFVLSEMKKGEGGHHH
ncbi:MAG: efflux RND transporter periplasmic adaptor subunit [Balneolaceae bacterium]|nr:efflux RND transporter periplasmic adaptor subunit [Balneolaceae bacterium]